MDIFLIPLKSIRNSCKLYIEHYCAHDMYGKSSVTQIFAPKNF